MWTYLFCLVLTLNAITGFTNGEKSSDVKEGDSELYFLNDSPGDQIEGSALDEEFTDLDHSSGRGVDDEDAPGSGFGPDDDDDDDEEDEEDEDAGSGGLSPLEHPQNPVRTTTMSTTTTVRSRAHDKGISKHQPPLPDEENRIPDALDPVTHETSTRRNLPDAVPTKFTDSNTHSNEVHIMGQKQDERPTSFFGQPGILAAVIGGAVVGLLCAILLVMFIVYRMRKKDEGSYALDEPKRSPTVNSYTRSSNKEFYA
ncbi:LOW QUALITY PROTEIN: syndecan-like [Uloborus diversus]|uniref:LOW QUALITY PROTEIN: syndecan-like n=1 Tax=Uloborus diversus TaxID=327109 RepID=UPI00240957F7|nr:LOW QUALITY PROTEIN: syndecan-like [Uloborus diversus]